MSSPRGKWLLAIAAAVAASCWDGSLDPILGTADGGDLDADTDTGSDTGSDTDTDNGTDTGTEPVECLATVPVYDPDSDFVICTYEASGTCVGEASECIGCAWAEAVTTGCSDGQSCCIGETVSALCTSWWGGWECAYAEGSCPEESWTVWSTDPSELPVCPGGKFCCA
jgi:hypothetical protein